MVESSFVKAQVLKMIEWIKSLALVGVELLVKMSSGHILLSLPDSFSEFIINFNVSKIHTSLLWLLNMLTNFEGNLKKEKPQVLFVSGTKERRKVAFSSKRGKGNKQSKATVERKDDNDK